MEGRKTSLAFIGGLWLFDSLIVCWFVGFVVAVVLFFGIGFLVRLVPAVGASITLNVTRNCIRLFFSFRFVIFFVCTSAERETAASSLSLISREYAP